MGTGRLAINKREDGAETARRDEGNESTNDWHNPGLSVKCERNPDLNMTIQVSCFLFFPSGAKTFLFSTIS